jgi:hypothetical protein
LRFADERGAHLLNIENADDKADAVDVRVAAVGVGSDQPNAYVVGVLADEVDDMTLFRRMRAEGRAGIGTGDRLRERQRNGGLAAAGSPGHRVDEAAL